MSSATLQAAARLLRHARHALVLTGAGASAESGIPTFRDALTGLWARFDPEELATPEAYRRNPPLVWAWYQWRRNRVLEASPNAGHRAIARLAGRVPALTVVTQNVDDLHERAGSRDVIHLHGSILTARCFDCGAPCVLPDGPLAIPADGVPVPPPHCTRCHGVARPDVVWFGEPLPAAALAAAERAVASADLVLSIGTSGLVYPAAGLAPAAARRGAAVVEINPDETPLTAIATHFLQGPAGQVLPPLLAAAWPEQISD